MATFSASHMCMWKLCHSVPLKNFQIDKEDVLLLSKLYCNNNNISLYYSTSSTTQHKKYFTCNIFNPKNTQVNFIQYIKFTKKMSENNFLFQCHWNASRRCFINIIIDFMTYVLPFTFSLSDAMVGHSQMKIKVKVLPFILMLLLKSMTRQHKTGTEWIRLGSYKCCMQQIEENDLNSMNSYVCL